MVDVGKQIKGKLNMRFYGNYAGHWLGFGGGLWGLIMGIILVAAVITIVVVILVRKPGSRNTYDYNEYSSQAIDLLNERLARGEIAISEYEEIKRKIGK